MLGDAADVRCDQGVRVRVRVRGDGGIDAEVLHPLQTRLRNGRLAEEPVSLCGVVEGLVRVEEREGFCIDRPACCEY